MQDVLIVPQQSGLYDMVIDEDARDFKPAEGFETAIPVSLFTDARAEESLVPNPKNRRGWVGNISTLEEGFELGSLLWTLDQSRLIEDTLNRARVEARAALDWMLLSGLVTQIQVDVERNDQREITIQIQFQSIENVIKRYVTLWRKTDATQLPTV